MLLKKKNVSAVSVRFEDSNDVQTFHVAPNYIGFLTASRNFRNVEGTAKVEEEWLEITIQLTMPIKASPDKLAS